MPRKSLSARNPNTPTSSEPRKRAAPETSSPSRPVKRPRRGRHSEDADERTVSVIDDKIEAAPRNGPKAVEQVSTVVPEEPTAEELETQLEAWQDFAADHYEMVEQLPLELHRNFRLLRELDDDCAVQTAKLHELVREYVGKRLGEKVSIPPASATADGAQKLNGEVAEETEPQQVDVATNQQAGGDMDAAKDETTPAFSTLPPPSVPDEVEIHRPEDLGIPQPDGQGGLLLPPTNPDDSTENIGPLPFPDSSAPNAPPAAEKKGERMSASSDRTIPGDLLPEIGRLAREIVRNGEEKVAVALGAYNAVDRHIRALDSALSAQEASMVLGLRNDTVPSTAVEDALNLAGDNGAIHEDDHGGISIGIGGGGGRRGKKGRKGRKTPAEAEVVPEPVAAGLIGPDEMDIDPNEPRYCVCNQVSYGEMVGCENDDCPYEWFHLACVGMTAVPSAAWWCDACRPKKTGLGMGGANTVKPKTGPAARMKKSKGSRK